MPRKKYGETSFGKRFQNFRKARGLTQVQLAEAAETTQRAISYYETESHGQWKRFQMISTLPERDQKAVVRLINSLVVAGPRNCAQGERHG